MGKLMITESNYDVQTSTDENKRLYIEGIFATADVKNANGRVYKKNLWEREIEKISPKITENSLIGELNHPMSRSEVDFNEAALKITELKWKDNHVMGKAMVLSTPKGQLVKNLIDDGVRIGISSRGLGTVTEGAVNDDFQLLTWDIVHNPSNSGSWVNGILEGFEVKADTEEQDKLKAEQDRLEQIKLDEAAQVEQAKDDYAKRILDILSKI